MPPAEGEATTPAVEAGPEVPEVAVDGEGKVLRLLFQQSNCRCLQSKRLPRKTMRQ